MSTMMTKKLSIGATLGAVLALTSGCAQNAALSKEQEAALAPYHTTCLKMGLAVDTPEHAECVISLYQTEQQRVARIRDVVAPPPPPRIAMPTQTPLDASGL